MKREIVLNNLIRIDKYEQTIELVIMNQFLFSEYFSCFFMFAQAVV